MNESPKTTPTNEAGPNQETLTRRRAEVIQELRDDYGILFITLIPPEVLQKFGVAGDNEWFAKALGLPSESKNLRTIRPITDGVPDTVEESGIIIGGSPLAVYEQANEPWMRKLKEFLLAMHKRGKPMLGVCYGHQLLAHAFGGKVEKNSLGREYGTIKVDLTDAGATDPIFQDMPRNFLASESHQDVVTSPSDAELVPALVLAENEKDGNHALAFGKNTRSVQFHPEIGPDVLTKIGEARKDLFINEGFVANETAHAELLRSIKDTPEARQVLRNFLVKFVLKK